MHHAQLLPPRTQGDDFCFACVSLLTELCTCSWGIDSTPECPLSLYAAHSWKGDEHMGTPPNRGEAAVFPPDCLSHVGVGSSSLNCEALTLV